MSAQMNGRGFGTLRDALVKANVPTPRAAAPQPPPARSSHAGRGKGSGGGAALLVPPAIAGSKREQSRQTLTLSPSSPVADVAHTTDTPKQQPKKQIPRWPSEVFERFFFIWTPEGYRPSKRIYSVEEARREQARLKEQAPGREFHIFEARMVESQHYTAEDSRGPECKPIVPRQPTD